MESIQETSNYFYTKNTFVTFNSFTATTHHRTACKKYQDSLMVYATAQKPGIPSSNYFQTTAGIHHMKAHSFF
jgi:hypothetical protein